MAIPIIGSSGPGPGAGTLRASPLSRYLLAAYVLLVAYASLYPLGSWRDAGGPLLAFLGAPWPRYVTSFDLASNFLGYLPLGLLAVLAMQPRLAGPAAVVAAAAGGGVLSLGLEAAQNYLPARIPSNADLLANFAGSLAGALGARAAAPWILGTGPLRRLRGLAFAPGAATDLGLALLGLWLFAQLNPASLLFGTGDLRDLFSGALGQRYTAELFASVEAMVTAANLAAVSLFASAVARTEAPIARLAALLVAVALLVKMSAFAVLMRAEHVLAWLTPGAQQGLAVGAALAAAALWLPRTARIALAAVLLMAATVLVNLAPPNPYLAATLKVWEQGHFLNFNGLTRLVSAAWPFAALAYLVSLAAALRREPLR